MSGGRFGFVQYNLSDVADSIREHREREMKDPDYPLPADIAEKFEEAAKTCELASVMVQRVDWLLSGDDGYDSFRERWAEEVKKAST